MTESHPGPVWRKSSRCGTSTCVEVANTDDGVLLRDSKNPDQVPLRISMQDWTGFLDAVAAGDYRD
jgi:hypothetical protein